MKNIFYILIAACVLISCKHPDKELEQRISGADSMAINYFRGDGTMDTVVAVRIIRDKQQIKQIAGLIAASPAERNNKCGYDGSLHFFKMNQVVQDIDFRMNDGDCMYFSFLQNGKHQATGLSKEAKELITLFRK